MEDICSVQAKPHHGIYGVSRLKAFLFLFYCCNSIKIRSITVKVVGQFCYLQWL